MKWSYNVVAPFFVIFESMIRFVVSTCLIFLTLFELKGQTLRFSKVYDLPGDDHPFGIVEIPHGYIIAGSSKAIGEPPVISDLSNIYIMCIDTFGHTLWKRFYEKKDENCAIYVSPTNGHYFENSLVKTKDTNIVALAQITFNKLFGALAALKFDNNGDTLWLFKDTLKWDIEPLQMIEDRDGNILVLGVTNRIFSQNLINVVIKLDKNGKLIWRKHINIGGFWFQRLTENINNNGYILWGSPSMYDNRKPLADTSIIYGIDFDGNHLYTNVLFKDTTNSPQTEWKFETYQVKLDSVKKQYKIAFNYYQNNQALAWLDSNFNIIKLMYLPSSNHLGLSFNIFHEGYQYLKISQTNSFESFDTNSNLNMSTYLPNLSPRDISYWGPSYLHGGMFFLGATDNYALDPSTLNGSDFFFIKTGNAFANSDFLQFPYIAIYPNPAHKGALIEFYLENNGTFKLTIWNQFGQTVYESIKNSNELGNYIEEIDISTFPSGIYHVGVEHSGKIFREKLVVK